MTRRIQNPTPDDLAAVAARWETAGSSQEDETTVTISGYEPEVFHIWAGRGPDVRSILRRADGRVLMVEEHPHGVRFTFPRSALAAAGPAALLRSRAASEAARARGAGFFRTASGSDDATDDAGGEA